MSKKKEKNPLNDDELEEKDDCESQGGIYRRKTTTINGVLRSSSCAGVKKLEIKRNPNPEELENMLGNT